MPLTIQDNIPLTAALDAIGGTVTVGVQRIFKAVGVHNPTGLPVPLLVYLVPFGEVAGDDYLVIDRPVLANKSDLCLQLIGRGLNGGGTLMVSADGCNIGFTSIDTVIAN